ncbi:MAG: universal stress protein [Pseudomonadota bacterium]
MYQRILVPLDGSATAECGLREALALAQAQRSSLYLLHALESFPLTNNAQAVVHGSSVPVLLVRQRETLVPQALPPGSDP